MKCNVSWTFCRLYAQYFCNAFQAHHFLIISFKVLCHLLLIIGKQDLNDLPDTQGNPALLFVVKFLMMLALKGAFVSR